MSVIKRIRTGDKVKIISGSNKGTVAKVVRVLPAEKSALLEGINIRTRHVKPTRLNPKGGKKDVHLSIDLSKLALVIDEKSNKTSRVGYAKNADGKSVRLARQANSKEIK